MAVVIGAAGTTGGLYFLHSLQTATNQPCTIAVPVVSEPSSTPNSLISATPSTNFYIVAAENFWGNLVSQLGGNRVHVTSIVTDPNADPHEYESNAANAQAFAQANFTIINGAGYDTWAERLIQAGSNRNPVLNVAQLLGKVSGDNPHFWYSPSYVNQTVHAMYGYVVGIDPANKVYYLNQYSSLNSSLGGYNSRILQIKTLYSGIRVASTESIFEYLATAAGLNLISPPAFMKAVAEGSDPSPQDIIQFQRQLQNRTAPGNATVLVFNQQTVTPLTEQMKQLAVCHHIPTVGVTETIQPTDTKFQDWMNGELLSLQNALNPSIGT